MNQDFFKNKLDEMIKAADICFEAELRTPALILIYCTIDILAWLTRPTFQPDVQKDDFVSWVEKYILPNTSLTCDAIDLYAARCALVHSYISESKLSRKGEAKQIFYAWGSANEEHLQKIIDAEGSYNAVSIHVDKLYNGLKKGIEKYLNVLVGDSQQAQIAYERAKKFFSDTPKKEIEKIDPTKI